MAFKALAEIKVNADGTITGRLLENPEVEDISLISNGVYHVGYDTFHCKVAIQFQGKDNNNE